jgi:hypothetical protein
MRAGPRQPAPRADALGQKAALLWKRQFPSGEIDEKGVEIVNGY